MANATANYGFAFHKSPYGVPPSLIECVKLTGQGDIFRGDIVKFEGSGDSQGRPSIDVISDGDITMMGVVTGFKPADRNNLTVLYALSANEVVCYVMPMYPEIQWRVNSSEANLNDIGALFDVTTGGGDTLTGRSGFTMKSEAGTTTSVKALRLIGFDRRTDNAFNATVSTDTDDVDCIVVAYETIWLAPTDAVTGVN